MRITWQASGSPRAVREAIADQARASRQQYPDAGALIVSARDLLVAGAVGEAPLAVHFTCTWSIEAVEQAPEPVVFVADVERRARRRVA